MKRDKAFEKLVCNELASICRKRYSLDEVIALHQKAYDHYKWCVTSRYKPVNPIDVAYVNALARYAATKGVPLREIR